MMLDGVVRALSSVRARIGIADVFVGYSYAAATASDGVRRCVGLAATPRADISCRDERWSFPRIGRDAGALAGALRSSNVLERTIALAAANAISQCIMRGDKPAGLTYVDDPNGWLAGRLRDAGARRVALIGNMPPVVSRLSEEFELTIFERDPSLRFGGALPNFLEPRLLPRVDGGGRGQAGSRNLLIVDV